MAKMASVFISYRGKDARKAKRLAERITRAGHKVWLDQWRIKIGDSIVGSIDEGLAKADYLVLCYSSAGGSPWWETEWQSTLARQLSGLKVKILPVMLTDGPVPHILRDLKYADLAADWTKGVAELLRAIRDSRQ
jgi:TIR domain-containing protein